MHILETLAISHNNFAARSALFASQNYWWQIIRNAIGKLVFGQYRKVKCGMPTRFGNCYVVGNRTTNQQTHRLLAAWLTLFALWFAVSPPQSRLMTTIPLLAGFFSLSFFSHSILSFPFVSVNCIAHGNWLCVQCLHADANVWDLKGCWKWRYG